MAVIAQEIHERYALYHGDCCEVLAAMPAESVHLSLHSPPFAGLYHYSSSERDLSNCRNYDEFLEHYGFVVGELFRLAKPGRVAAVHCMDVPGDGANLGGETIDFPGDLIRLYKHFGWRFANRYHVWKEPLAVRNRTMMKGLAHCQVVEDSVLCDNAAADQLLMFRKPGVNAEPVRHPVGLTSYAGSREMPADVLKYKGYQGDQIRNKYSHNVWRRYASAFWDDVRLDRVLPYTEPPDSDDEPHFHPLQLDVIERAVVLWTNPGDVVLTPFMGVGSEVYGAVANGRKGVGVELKPSFYRQAVKNVRVALEVKPEQPTLYDALESAPEEYAAAPVDETLPRPTLPLSSDASSHGRRRLGRFVTRKDK